MAQTRSEQQISFDMNTIRLANMPRSRLEYLRGEIKAERISYGELAELRALSKYIDSDDVLLREWAGLKE